MAAGLRAVTIATSLKMRDPTSFSARCIIVDDEEHAHLALSRLILQIPWLSVTGNCHNVEQAVTMILRDRPDIIFLDVKLPGASGLDLLKSLPFPRPAVIMVTAHRKYAWDGYENEVADFLLKPVTQPRLIKALLKLDLFRQGEKPGATRIIDLETSAAREAKSSQPDQRILWVRVDGKMLRIGIDEIVAVTGLGDFVKIYFGAGMAVTKRTMASVQAELPADQFIRIHRSHIVNRLAVRSIHGNVVTLFNGAEYMISGRGNARQQVISRLTRGIL